MLKKGSRGEEVKQLQKMLRDAGYFKYKKDTGYFGDITEQALKDFQTARGLKADGIYGVASSDALTNDAKIRVALANPNLTPEQKKMMQDMYTQGDHRINSYSMGTVHLPEDLGNKVANIQKEVENQNLNNSRDSILLGEGGYIPYDAYDANIKEQMNTYAPYYDELQRKDRAMFDQSVGNQNRNYNLSVKSLDEGLADDVTDFYDKEANTGVFGSGSRAERLKSIKNKYNNQYSNLYNTAQNNLFNTRTNFAYQYGDAEALKNNNPISRFQVDPTQGNNGQTQIETGGQYDPFNLYGRNNAEKDFYSKKASNDYYINNANKGAQFFTGT